jgi:hypothetical protein
LNAASPPPPAAGVEEAGLSYEEAAGLVARLRAERLSGLCVISDEAASRVHAAKKSAAKPPAGGNSKAAPAGSKPRRGRKKKDS